MSVPFSAVAVAMARVRPVIGIIRRHHRAFEIASGMLIAGVGVLVSTNAFGRLAGPVPWGF